MTYFGVFVKTPLFRILSGGLLDGAMLCLLALPFFQLSFLLESFLVLFFQLFCVFFRVPWFLRLGCDPSI